MSDELTQLGHKLEHLSAEALQEKLQSSGIIERVNAIAVLARKYGYDPTVSEILLQAIQDPINKGARTMGPTSVAHFGVAYLLKFGTAHARQQIKRLIESWEEPDRSDLIWFIRSQELDLPE
jgi:hypothetical protein